MLVLSLRYMILREKPSIALCITKAHLISLWLPSTCHSASKPGTQLFLLIISVSWVMQLRISTGSTRHNEDLTQSHVKFTVFALRCPFILRMLRFGNLDRMPLTILSSSRLLMSIYFENSSCRLYWLTLRLNGFH